MNRNKPSREEGSSCCLRNETALAQVTVVQPGSKVKMNGHANSERNLWTEVSRLHATSSARGVDVNCGNLVVLLLTSVDIKTRSLIVCYVSFL
jgi:hypothetical protein